MNTRTETLKSNTLKKLFKNRQINLVIKVIIFLLLSYSIYQQVFAKDNISDIWQSFLASFTASNSIWLLLVMALTPINWGLESLKWQQLIKGFSNLSFWKIYQAILAGVTFSLFTPNRVGEYGGRVLMVEPENNWKAVVATLVGSFSQLLILLSAGLMGIIYFGSTFIDIEAVWLKTIFGLGLVAIGGLVWGFYHVEKVVPIARQLPYYDKLKKVFRHLKVLTEYDSRQLSKTLLFSLGRYLVYSFQYIFILHFFGIEVPILVALAGISTIFLIQTSIPLPPVMGLFARGEVALYIWGFFSANEINILAATFGLFIINLTVPALLGMIFIVKVNVLKSLGYEEKLLD